MTLLLDTAAFIFLITGDDRLSSRALSAIADTQNDLLISVASLWELAIKTASGKFEFQEPLPSLIPGMLRRYGILPVSIEGDDALAVVTLPNVHRDPFDRMIIAQAKRRACPVVTSDRVFSQYPVQTIW